MHGNIYVATSPGRYKGICIVYMADVYEGMHISSILRQVTASKIGMCVSVCVYLYRQYNDTHVCIHQHV